MSPRLEAAITHGCTYGLIFISLEGTIQAHETRLSQKSNAIMCKRSIADSMAKSCDCSNPDYSWAVADLDDETDWLYDGEPTLGRMLEATVGWYNFDDIKSQIYSLTKDILPVFGMQNICVCKLPDKQYCYLPAKTAEFQAADAALVRVLLWELCSADGTTNEVEGAILPYWNHEPGEFMLHSAMQLETQMITHDDALPFWAALMDSARSGEGDAKRSTRSPVRTPERLDAAKKQEVLDYLHQAAANIRVHLKPFSKGEVKTRAGFCCAFPLEQDGSDKRTNRPEFYHGCQDGKPALKDYFVHLYMNIEVLVDFNMWTCDWMRRTAADLREAMLTFATELCHQFAHAMADIFLRTAVNLLGSTTKPSSSLGFSFEQFIFDGRLNPGGDGGFWDAPWPDYSTEQFCANGAGKQDLCAFGRATLPPPETWVLGDKVWQQLFEQRF